MQVMVDVHLRGTRGAVHAKALVDTGAEVSLVPATLANQVGA